MKRIRSALVMTGVLAAGLASGGAKASVILTGESFTTLGPTNVSATILASGTESGGSRLLSNGSPASAPSNTILPWQVLSIAQLGLSSASDLRLIVGVSETDSLLTSSALGVQFFSPTGALLYTATAAQVFNLNTATVNGQGFVFRLDSTSATEAQAAAFGNPNNLIGTFATFVNSTGGAETLYLASIGSAPPPARLPEPGTYGLLGLGLLALLRVTRRSTFGRPNQTRPTA